MGNMLARLVLSVVPMVLGMSVSHASLVGRDINGNPVNGSDASAVFLYDTDLNITWLRNAGAGAGTIYDASNLTPTDGYMTWDSALQFTDTLVVGRYDDWRLPKSSPVDPTCSFQTDGGPIFGELDFGYHCTGSELGHLRYLELGNPDFSLTNVGDFQNIGIYSFWTSTTFAPNPINAINTNFVTGFQGAGPKDGGNAAWAVRDGDVFPGTQNNLPEPGGLSIFALAVFGLAWSRLNRSNIVRRTSF
jgi:hypothetical protein